MWVLQSRSRLHNIARFARAWKDTKASTEVLIRIDEDDPLADGYLAMDMPAEWRLQIGPRMPFAAMFNDIYAWMPGCDWYGFLADDIVPETIGWDRLLIDAAGWDGLGYGDDGINGAKLATHFALGGNIVRAAGWLALPGLDRLYIDTTWNDIARAKGTLRYLPDVKIPHLHFSNHGAPLDAGYRKPGRARDRATYETWKESHDAAH